jgi:hypothetical protein
MPSTSCWGHPVGRFAHRPDSSSRGGMASAPPPSRCVLRVRRRSYARKEEVCAKRGGRRRRQSGRGPDGVNSRRATLASNTKAPHAPAPMPAHAPPPPTPSPNPHTHLYMACVQRRSSHRRGIKQGGHGCRLGHSATGRLGKVGTNNRTWGRVVAALCCPCISFPPATSGSPPTQSPSRQRARAARGAAGGTGPPCSCSERMQRVVLDKVGRVG